MVIILMTIILSLIGEVNESLRVTQVTLRQISSLMHSSAAPYSNQSQKYSWPSQSLQCWKGETQWANHTDKSQMVRETNTAEEWAVLWKILMRKLILPGAGAGGGEQRHCWGRNIGTKARDRGTDLKKGREGKSMWGDRCTGESTTQGPREG